MKMKKTIDRDSLNLSDRVKVVDVHVSAEAANHLLAAKSTRHHYKSTSQDIFGPSVSCSPQPVHR